MASTSAGPSRGQEMLGTAHSVRSLALRGGGDEEQEEICSFVLLAEFDIDAGSGMAHQYPYPTGTDEQRLADLMLPDGVHDRGEDHTIFYLGQSLKSTIDPILTYETGPSENPRASVVASSTARPKAGAPGGGLLYVLSHARCVADKTVRRGARVKAMAIASPKPWLDIWKRPLVWQLGKYFEEPNVKLLEDLYEMCNAMPLALAMPRFSRYEKILLRQETKRSNMLAEEYDAYQDNQMQLRSPKAGRGSDLSTRTTKTAGGVRYDEHAAESLLSAGGEGGQGTLTDAQRRRWITPQPDDGEERLISIKTTFPAPGDGRSRDHSRQSSMSGTEAHTSTESGSEQLKQSIGDDVNDLMLISQRGVAERDTRFLDLKTKKPVMSFRVPTNTFDDDVGSETYSISSLFSDFKDHPAFPGPFRPHLHTSGASTPAIILILNALLSGSRVIFLSKHAAKPACEAVLAACALASGCGQVIRRVPQDAYPYANIANVDDFEHLATYVAGTKNPRLAEILHIWDVLVDLENKIVTVNKNPQPVIAGSAKEQAGSVRSGRSSDTSLTGSVVKIDQDGSGGTPQGKMSAQSKAESVDLQFMEELQQGFKSNYGEGWMRRKFTDWLQRFIQLTAYHEYATTGSTKVGFPTVPFRDGHVGSGILFVDEQAKHRELAQNGPRIEAWRRTKGYRQYVKDWADELQQKELKYDVGHQFARLRIGKYISDEEAVAIFSTVARSTQTHGQVIELFVAMPSSIGGLQLIANGMFHRLAVVRDSAVDILTNLQHYKLGREEIAALPYFYRKAYLQLFELRHPPSIPVPQHRWAAGEQAAPGSGGSQTRSHAIQAA